MDVLFYQKYGETAAALKAGKETAEMLSEILKGVVWAGWQRRSPEAQTLEEPALNCPLHQKALKKDCSQGNTGLLKETLPRQEKPASAFQTLLSYKAAAVISWVKGRKPP